MDGWKSKTAGIAGILGSLAAIATAIAHDPIDFTMIWGGVTGVIASLATLGIAGKLQKLINAIKGMVGNQSTYFANESSQPK